MIVGGQTEARAQLSSTIMNYHELFDQGFNMYCNATCTGLKVKSILITADNTVETKNNLGNYQ